MKLDTRANLSVPTPAGGWHERSATAGSPQACLRRRQALARRLAEAGGGVAVVPTLPPATRNADVTHPYRGDSAFLHLTGFGEPESWLVLDAAGRSTLFCRPRDPEREIWDGPMLGVDDAPAVLGVDAAHPVSALDDRMPALLNGHPAVWTAMSRHEGLGARLDRWLQAAGSRAREGWTAPSAHRDLRPLLDEQRLRKDEAELAAMRRAAAISAAAHARAMRFAATALRDGAAGMPEYAIEAELLHEFRRHGAAGPAYPSIVAAGRNACVLHYEAGHGLLRPGDLCLVDAGCEFDGLASDITRTWPADGRFSGEQRALYDVVLAAQEAARAVTRPGARLRDGHAAAVRVLSQGMLDLGLLDRTCVGDVDAVIESGAYRAYYMHGTGHWLGRDVHDVGDVLSPDEDPVEEHDIVLGRRAVRRPSRRLEPGMVLTIEPGLYVRAGSAAPERFHGLGIRIEDDALVTPAGHELLTRDVPVDPDEIEALLRA